MKNQDEENMQRRFFLPSKLTIALFIAYLVLNLAFFYLLSVKSPQAPEAGKVAFSPGAFGFPEIILAIAIAIILTAVFSWVKSFIKKNRYLGAIIGLVFIGLFVYGLSFRFKGPYTTTFSIIGSIITLLYLGIYFFQYRGLDKAESSED